MIITIINNGRVESLKKKEEKRRILQSQVLTRIITLLLGNYLKLMHKWQESWKTILYCHLTYISICHNDLVDFLWDKWRMLPILWVHILVQVSHDLCKMMCKIITMRLPRLCCPKATLYMSELQLVFPGIKKLNQQQGQIGIELQPLMNSLRAAMYM